jgi:hypothetical protein
MKYFPANWQQYQRLQFRILNPSPQPLSLTCRIHDELHARGIQRYQDRFNQTYAISQGWNIITINIMIIIATNIDHTLQKPTRSS